MSAALLCAVVSYAQPVFDNHTVTNFGVPDGLSQNTVRDLAFDTQGFLWIGSYDGLNRFDGSDFRVFKPQPGNALSVGFKQVRSLMVGKAGLVWIRNADLSISCYDPHDDRLLEIRDGRGRTTTLHDSQILMMPDSTAMFYGGDDGALYYKYDQHKGLSCIWQDSLRYCRALMADNDLWICGEMLVRINPDGSEQRVPVRGMNGTATAFCVDDGIAYVTDGSSHVRRVNLRTAKTLTEVMLPDGVERVNNVAVLGNGLLVFRYANGKLLVYNTLDGSCPPLTSLGAEGLAEASDVVFFYDRGGGLWFYDRRGVVYHYMAEMQRFQSLRVQSEETAALVEHAHVSIIEDRFLKGVYWVTSYGGGLLRYDSYTGKAETIRSHKGFLPEYLLCVTQDAYGNVWVGSEGLGVAKVADKQFASRLILSPRPGYRSVKTVFEAPNGNVWVGVHNGGLYVWDNNLENCLQGFEGLKPRSVVADPQGRIWVGTQGHGLYVFDQNTHMQLAHFKNNPSDPSSISSDVIFRMLVDRVGRLWVGAVGGALEMVNTATSLDRVQFRHFLQPNANRRTRIRDIYQDSEDYIWLATADDGIFSFLPDELVKDPDAYVSYAYNLSTPDGLGSMDIRAICEDDNHQIWVATAGGGLNRLILDVNRARFEKYTKAQGLPSDVVNSMISLGDSILWLGTEDGLVRFNTHDKSVVTLRDSERKFGNSFNEQAVCLRQNKRLIWGSIAGLIDFDPVSRTAESSLPKPIITGIWVDGHLLNYQEDRDRLDASTSYAKRLMLSENDTHVTIRFSSLNFKDGENGKYVYQLKGLNEEWLRPLSDGYINLDYLKGGTYVLRIRGVNSGEDRVRELALVVDKPLWHMPFMVFFYMVAAALGVVALLYLGYLQTAKTAGKIAAIAVDDYKKKFFLKMNSQIRVPVKVADNAMGSVGEKLIDSPPSVRPLLFVVRENLHKVSEIVDALLDFGDAAEDKVLSVENTPLTPFLNDVFRQFKRQSVENNIKYTLNVRGGWTVPLDRHKIEKVLLCLISNAFRNTPSGGAIDVSAFEDEEGRCVIVVSDNGLGVPENRRPQLMTGFFEGMDNEFEITLSTVYRFVRIHHGRILFAPNVDGGTVFTVILPAEYQESADAALLFSDDEGISDGANSLLERRMRADNVPLSGSLIDMRPLVMVVDDKPQVRDFLGERLMAHYRVISAPNGQVALGQLQGLTPDLVICDGRMAVMGGVELCRRMRTDFNLCHIPIILLSSHPDDIVDFRSDFSGPNEVVGKPVAFMALLRVVQTLLEKSLSATVNFDVDNGAMEHPDEYDRLFLYHFVDEIKVNVMRANFGIDDIADRMHLSANEINRRIVRLTGVDAGTYVKLWRLDFAAKSLAGSQTGGALTAAKAMENAGFSDMVYFSKSFYRVYGHRPSDVLAAVN